SDYANDREFGDRSGTSRVCYYHAQTLPTHHHSECAHHDYRCIPVDSHDTLYKSAGSHHLHGDCWHRPGSVFLCTDNCCPECITTHASRCRHCLGEVSWSAWCRARGRYCWNRGEPDSRK